MKIILMKNKQNLLFLLVLLVAISCKKEDGNNTPTLTNKVYDNGPLSTGNLNAATPPVTAPTGYTWSELQLNNNTIGFSIGSGYIIADDFVVPAGESWKIDSIKTYCYASGHTLSTSPVYATRIRIWKGQPDQVGSSVVVGDTITNVLKSSRSSYIYRIYKNGNTFTREIWESTSAFNSSISLTLTEGIYWLEIVQYAGDATYMPPVTITGQLNKSGGNGIQKERTIAASYSTVKDFVSNAQQDFPFKIHYRK